MNEGGTADVSTSPGSGGSSIADELADLRRQVVFLQGQVEDRDRTIQVLQVRSFIKNIFLRKYKKINYRQTISFFDLSLS